MLVHRDDPRVEHEPEPRGPRVGAEERVLAAVALVPADGRVARDGHAERRHEGRLTGRAAGEVGSLDLEVRHPAPGSVRREGARAADQGVRELPGRTDDRGAPARAWDGVGVEEDDEIAARRVPARVPRASREAPCAGRDDPCAALARRGLRRVRRAVVDHDHLDGRGLLGGERVEHPGKRPLGVPRRDHDAVGQFHARDDIQQSLIVFRTSTGATASGPIVSVSFGYFASQRVEPIAPERTESWMLTVCAAPPPKWQSTQTTSSAARSTGRSG